MKIKVELKPLSVNRAWQGKRFKTPEYKSFEKYLMLLLPKLDIKKKEKLKVDFVFGFATKASDIDNPVKPCLDVMQKKYGINDNDIFELNIKKEVVGKGNEFIELRIEQI
tara:strand:+ start:33 stop:362 length:330 start_codon:yes stop_codon:yes gene_type:complete